MKLALSTLTMLFLFLAVVNAQTPDYWEATGGPNNSFLIASPNGSVFANAGYIYRTTDNGSSWSVIDTLAVQNAGIFGADAGGNLYAVTWRAGMADSLLCSKDNGNTWSGVYQLEGSSLASITALLFTSGGGIYAGNRITACISLRTAAEVGRMFPGWGVSTLPVLQPMAAEIFLRKQRAVQAICTVPRMAARHGRLWASA